MKNNKNLLNKKRFEKMENEKMKYLQNLSIKESIKIMEEILDSDIIIEFNKAKKQIENAY
jgi:hypothetical protein